MHGRFGSYRIGLIVHTSAMLFNESQFLSILNIHKESTFKYSHTHLPKKRKKKKKKVNITAEAVRKEIIETLGGLLEPIEYFHCRGPHRG